MTTDVSGQPISPIFKGRSHFTWTAWPLDVCYKGCPATSASKYQPTPRNIPEEQRPHLLAEGSLRSRKLLVAQLLKPYSTFYDSCVGVERDHTRGPYFVACKASSQPHIIFLHDPSFQLRHFSLQYCFTFQHSDQNFVRYKIHTFHLSQVC